MTYELKGGAFPVVVCQLADGEQMVTEKVAVDIHTEELDKQIGKTLADKLRGDLELIEGVYPEHGFRQE